MLLFKKKFLEAIRRGEKSQTVRLWVRPRMKSGQRSYIPGVGYIRIASVEPVEIEELTDADAVPDGFRTADALRAEISAIYSQYPDRGQKAYRIRFTLAPNETKRTAVQDRRRESGGSGKNSGVRGQGSDSPVVVAEQLSQAISSSLTPSRIVLPSDGFLVAQSRKKSINP